MSKKPFAFEQSMDLHSSSVLPQMRSLLPKIGVKMHCAEKFQREKFWIGRKPHDRLNEYDWSQIKLFIAEKNMSGTSP
jgi:hypothetical protein